MVSKREFSCEARGSVRPTRVFRFKSNYLPRRAVSGKKKMNDVKNLIKVQIEVLEVVPT